MKRTLMAGALILSAILLSLRPWVLLGAEPAGPKPATEATQAANRQTLEKLPFADGRQDFEDARRGLIAEGTGIVLDAQGRKVWDATAFGFLAADEAGPATVNPSLWRHARLNSIHGLFQVAEGLYQVRGYDLSNVSFIVGRTGYIVVDPLVCAETARAALDLLRQHVGEKPVVAVIYSHSHIDHFGGVKGIISEDDVSAGRVRVIASEGFLEHAVSENVILANVMGRRATYMYGSLLPHDPTGHVDTGLGKGISSGRVTLIAPTEYIKATGQEAIVDGVPIIFQMTPGGEAPTEMNLYLPRNKALYIADNCIHTLHNLYTLRGAEVRDAKAWSGFLNETIDLFGGRSEVMFAGHHWPCWGAERMVDMLKKQRDLYKFIHDQTIRLANQGYTATEIAEKLKLPAPLASEWYNRGYYGTVRHNVKAVYQKYIGWFDANPANLDPLPPAEAGRKYVEFMGGSAALLEKARQAYGRGEFRWVAQVVNHLVFAEPDNREARELQADALEQLGYQAESGTWRNFYLSGARELRDSVTRTAAPQMGKNSDVGTALKIDMIFDYLAVRLNGPRAAGKTVTLNWDFTDTKEQYVLKLENCALSHVSGKQAPAADATLTLSKATLIAIVSGRTSIAKSLAAGAVRVQGDARKLVELFSLMDDFDFWFNIVTPNDKR